MGEKNNVVEFRAVIIENKNTKQKSINISKPIRHKVKKGKAYSISIQEIEGDCS